MKKIYLVVVRQTHIEGYPEQKIPYIFENLADADMKKKELREDPQYTNCYIGVEARMLR